jgi:hypothetical protein
VVVVPSRLGPFVVAFDVIPTAQGIISVSVPANNVKDLGYNPNLASTCGVLPGPCSFLFDSVRPTATITTSTLAITNTLLPYNVTFSEPVQYFNASNINVYGKAIVLEGPWRRFECTKHLRLLQVESPQMFENRLEIRTCLTSSPTSLTESSSSIFLHSLQVSAAFCSLDSSVSGVVTRAEWYS